MHALLLPRIMGRATHPLNAANVVGPLLEVAPQDLEFAVCVSYRHKSIKCRGKKNYLISCTVSFTCGQTTSQNNSYFSNAGYPSSYDAIGTCQLSITKESSDIAQIRWKHINFGIFFFFFLI